jgi:hypothetical protein
MDRETPIRLLAIKAASQDSGFYIAFVPADLDDSQMQAAYVEIGIEPEQSLTVDGWQTTSQHVAFAFVPFPPRQLAELLTPSQS